MTSLILACLTFVGTHFLLSHPLRAPLVGAMGERAFAGVYSLVAAASLAWLVLAFVAAPTSAFWWPVGDALWAAVSVVMLVASILLVGSLIGNPAFPNPGAATTAPSSARGVFAVTRHPMLWSFALWGLAHVAVYPVTKSIVVATSIVVLSLVGAGLQDKKKEKLQPAMWTAWERCTSYVPFAAIAAGRARLQGFGARTLVGGVAVWLLATWAHIPLAGWRAGLWKWL